MNLSTEEQKHFDETSECHICKGTITDKDPKGQKVRDHCHYTGKFRGAAHNICNLNYKDSKKIPVFFHNLSGYDGHSCATVVQQYNSCTTVVQQLYNCCTTVVQLLCNSCTTVVGFHGGLFIGWGSHIYTLFIILVGGGVCFFNTSYQI